MPEGRWIPSSLNDDYRLNNVSVEAELLYRKLWNKVDRDARLKAEPKWILNSLFPLRDYSADDVLGWLNELAAQKKQGKGLVELYEVDSYKYLWLPDFLPRQTKSWLNTGRNREAESEIPEPPKDKGRFPVE